MTPLPADSPRLPALLNPKGSAPDSPGVAATEAPSEAEEEAEEPASSSRPSPGAMMQAQLMRVAKKHADGVAAKGITPKTRHAKLVHTLAKLLGRSKSGDDTFELDEGNDDDDSSGALALFRHAPSSLAGPETTPVFAARKPGELIAGGVL